MEKSITIYIREVLKRSGLNQSQLADRLGISRGEITVYLKRGVIPNDLTCIKLAKFAGDSPEKVLLLAAESRATEETKSIWENISKASGFSAVVLFILLSATSPAQANKPLEERLSFDNNIHYATNRRRRRRPSLAFLPA